MRIKSLKPHAPSFFQTGGVINFQPSGARFGAISTTGAQAGTAEPYSGARGNDAPTHALLLRRLTRLLDRARGTNAVK